MSNLYEIEVKSLLGSQERADELKDKIKKKGGTLVSQSKQLNHYFVLNNAQNFKKSLLPRIPKSKHSAFEKITDEGTDFSVRTRESDGKVLLVVKASIGDDTSSNGVSRMEFEAEMPMSLEELDNLLLSSGLEYQAKWSREREEYKIGDANVCLDKNAGYGYLAEFEKVISDKNEADAAKQEIFGLMRDFGVDELPQDRLERMFEHYNNNWSDYYGTEKVFNIE